MSIQAISWALDESQAAGSNRLVVIVMCHYTYDDGFSGLAKATLADETRLSQATIVRAQSSLIALGEIERATEGDAPAWWLALPVNRRPALFKMTGFLGSHYATPIHRRARGITGVSLGSRRGLIGVTDTPSDQGGRETNRDKRTVNSNETDLSVKIGDDFEVWWKSYPRKVEKADALKAYKARRKAGAKPDDLLRSCRNYAGAVADTEKHYIKHGESFLNASWAEWIDGPPEGWSPGSSRNKRPLLAHQEPLPVHPNEVGAYPDFDFRRHE